MKFRTYSDINVGLVWKLNYLNVPSSAIINSSSSLYGTSHPEALPGMQAVHAGVISQLWNEEVVEGLPGTQERIFSSLTSALTKRAVTLDIKESAFENLMLNGGSNRKVFVPVVYFLILVLDKSAGGTLTQISTHNRDFFIMQRTKGWVNITINIQTYVPVKTHLIFSLQGQRKWTCANCVSFCVSLANETDKPNRKKRGREQNILCQKAISTHAQSCRIAGRLYWHTRLAAEIWEV